MKKDILETPQNLIEFISERQIEGGCGKTFISIRSPFRAMTIGLEPKELELLVAIAIGHWRKMIPEEERIQGGSWLIRKIVGE